MTVPAGSPPPRPVERPGFLDNVLWNWFGISISLFSAFFLSPFIIRRLGDDNYGLWAVTTALVDYYWLLDFGVRSATLRFAAHYNASGDFEKLSEAMSAAVAYNLALGPILVGGAWLAKPYLAAWTHIQN